MGLSSTTLLTSDAGLRRAASYPLERGTLEALTAQILQDVINPGQIIARISLAHDGDTSAHIAAILAEGDIATGIDVHWTGAITLRPGMRVLIESWSRVAATITLKALSSAEHELPTTL